MSYTDLRDFEADAVFTVSKLNAGDPELTIAIEKLGGGTVGDAYEGIWRYVVTFAGEVIRYGQDLHTGYPTTHEGAAVLLADCVSCDVDDIDLSDRLVSWIWEHETD